MIIKPLNLFIMRFCLLMLLLGYSVLKAQPTIPPPTQTDEIIIDNGATGKADPNDRTRYKVTIQNTGAGGAIGTQLNIVPDPRTTFVPGSFRSSPLALPDSYTCTGNVGITIPVASGLKVNDFDDNIAGLTITAGTFATTQGGSIMINADGSFMYTPPAGFTGNDTYSYTLNDSNGVGGSVPATDMAVVTITISNLIWFIDNSSMAATSDGRLTSPFKSLADFNAGSAAAGDVIYIEHTGINYTNGILLQDNERLYGEGHTGAANLSGVLPFTLAPNSKTLPNINGTRPIITNAAGDGVTLAMNNNLRGFDVGNCSDFGMDNTGTNSIGNLVVSEVSITNTTGGGFDASNGSGASMNVVFGSISSTGGVNGIDLTNCAGTFTVNGGTITNPTGTGVLISGGSVVFSTSGVITDNSGFAVDVDNHDSGNVTFSGNITSTGTGIRVQNCGGGTKTFSGSSKSLTTTSNNAVSLLSNAGATITFSNGGLVITTTSGIGFNATSGASAINVTGNGNTLNSSSGATCLNVNSSTIGSGNLNFQSITSVGGTAPGIVLDNTGANGGLTVNGDGTNTAKGGNGSGGTIANKTGADGSTTTGIGIYLNNTSNVILRRMQLNDFQNLGVFGTSVNGFTLQYSTINGSNGTSSGSNDACLAFGKTNPSGANGLNGANPSLIDNCKISGAIEHNMEFYNQSGSFSLTCSNSDITDNSTSFGGDGIQIEMQGTATATVSVQSCFFNNNKSQPLQGAANDDSALDITINTCTVTKTVQGNEGFIVSNGSNGDLTAHITNNNISGIGGVAIFVGQTPGNATSSSNLIAVISGNTINHPTSATNHAIFIAPTSTVGQISTANILVQNNNITENSTMGVSRPIEINTPDANTSPSFTVSVIGNTASVGDNVGGVGIQVAARQSSAGCFDIRNNTVTFPNGTPPGVFGLRARQAGSATANLEQGASSGSAATVLAANNPGSTTEVLGTVNVVSNSTCQSPPN